MNILGISAFYHDSAAALLVDGKIMAAAQEERFTRKKHDAGFPTEAIRYCLDHAGLSIDDLDYVAFYDKPFLKFERLMETYYNFAPAGFLSFLQALPVWLKEKIFLEKQIKDGLKEVHPYSKKKLKLHYPEHHLSHAASAFYPSPFEEAAILTVDGVGEWATASICHGKGKDITLLKELRFPHSLGLLYSAFTYFLGFRVNSGEYKLMGLAPYGDPKSPQLEEFKKKIREHLVDIREDGSIWLDQKYFNYAAGLRMAKDKKWEELFGFPKREAESALEQIHCNLGLAIQQITEEVVEKMAIEAKRLTNCDNLVMAGGVALNCVANGKVLNKDIFPGGMFIQPAAGDAGGALGAALSTWHIHQGQARTIQTPDSMEGAYLGPEFSGLAIAKAARKYKAPFQHFEDFEDMAKEVARLLDEGNVVGNYQGRMEFGPRALGNRSILGDPRSPEMQKKINLKIKYRESFRPFAPSVLAEHCHDYFDINGDSPYMLQVAPVADSHRKPVPANYHSLPIKEKLYFQRSDVPAITHIDYSARIQTVDPVRNGRYYTLIKAFYELTGCPMVVNTSFNVRGEPIVCTPEDAYRCFMQTEMDFLILGNYLFDKKEQPVWENKEELLDQYPLD